MVVPPSWVGGVLSFSYVFGLSRQVVRPPGGYREAEMGMNLLLCTPCKSSPASRSNQSPNHALSPAADARQRGLR